MTNPGHDYEALDLVPEAVVVVDADGLVVHRNDRARVLLGLDAPTGTPIVEALALFDDLGEDVTNCLLPRGSVADRIAERVLRVQLADGRRRAVSMSGRVGADRRTVLTFRHAGRRERLDSAASDLVATVSHEIRSPLTSVKGFTRTLLTKWERFSDEQKRQMLATINEDADRVTRLLTELLDVARIDAGRVRIDRRIAALEPVVRRVAEKISQAGDTSSIVVEADGGIPDLYIDPDKMEQILTNLLENAVRHGGGSSVRVSIAAAGQDVVLRVDDEGPGIAPEHHREVFAKFFRVRGDRRSGTGLGLYITKGLVEAHGGRVWVESVPGEGASFLVALPKGGIELARTEA